MIPRARLSYDLADMIIPHVVRRLVANPKGPCEAVTPRARLSYNRTVMIMPHVAPGEAIVSRERLSHNLTDKIIPDESINKDRYRLIETQKIDNPNGLSIYT